MKLFLVRHGKISFRNIGFLSYTDLDLTEEGKAQAQKVGQRLKDEEIDSIYSSELKRSIETANEITGCLDLEVRITPRLNEVNFGIFEGLTLSEAKDKFPEIFKKREKDKWNFKIPKGESYKDAAERVLPFIKKISQEKKKVVLVTHVTIIKILLKSLTDLSLEKIEGYHFWPTSVTILESKNAKFKPLLINDISHLK